MKFAVLISILTLMFVIGCNSQPQDSPNSPKIDPKFHTGELSDSAASPSGATKQEKVDPMLLMDGKGTEHLPEATPEERGKSYRDFLNSDVNPFSKE